MLQDKLTIDFDEEQGWVAFCLTSPYGDERKSSFTLRRDGFSIDDIREATLATGWVEQRDDALAVTGDVSGATLANFVSKMIAYFEAPGLPNKELLGIKDAVDEYYILQDAEPPVVIPLFAYAWLDLIVREDLADDARSADNVWSGKDLMIDVDKHCDYRVDELVRRYITGSVTRRMAASERIRASRKFKESRTG
jgi:hypothetical protein